MKPLDLKMPERDQYGRARTPYALFCDGPDYTLGPGCGLIYLSAEEYDAQMGRPDALWRCPQCRGDARWDDNNYDDLTQEPE